MLEWLAPTFVYGVLKDLVGWWRRRKRSPAERLAAVERWREPFGNEIYRCRTERLRQDAIIHDANRMDGYPDASDKKNISSWFRVGLVDQYHRGIEVVLSIHSLIFEESEGKWRIANYETEADRAIKGYLIGSVPYESIVSVNWDGDEYYYFPHIFCYFEHRGQPYEKLEFCRREVASTGKEFFVPLQSCADVRLTSQKFGTSKYVWTS